MSAAAEISMVFVRALADVVQQRGISPDVLIDRDHDALQAEAAERSLSMTEFQSLFTRAIQLTGDPALGLHCGLHASESAFGLMSPLVSHAPTLRHALALTIQFQSLLSESVHVKLVEHTGIARLRCELERDVCGHRSFVELIVAGLLRMVRQFGCTQSDIRAVCFEHARPAYYPAYGAVFGGAERFSQAFIGIEFATRALDRPHLHRHAELHKLIVSQAERSLQRRWRTPSCAERVRKLMNCRPVAKLPDMATAAQELGLSVRSLRRRLEEERTSYRELTQAALHETACSMLRNPSVTLQAVAHELGFADATAFHRAFRRWANVTPAEYRAERQAHKPAERRHAHSW